MKSKLIIMFAIFLFMSLAITSAALNVNLGPTLKIYDGTKKPVDLEDVNKEKHIFFELILTNSLKDYWICWESFTYRLEITKNAEQQDDLSISIQGRQCLAPNEEHIIWIPFDYYNKLKSDDRMGDWRISPKITLDNNQECYSINDVSNDKCGWGEIKPQQGNPVDFKVRKEETSTSPELNKFKKWFIDFWYFWVLGIGGGIVIIIAIVKALKRK